MAKKQICGISYGRVSTMNQLLGSNGLQREDASPAAQKSRCQAHAEYMTLKTGMEYLIIEHYSDEGFSAKNVNRPAYQKMWNMIASKSINFIISSELSRLSRSVTDFLALVSHCQEHQVDLIIIGLDLDTSNPFGRVIVVILVALAQFEREMTSMRVKENSLSRLLTDGKINGSAEILGLDRDPKHAGHFIRNDEELKNVEILMQQFLLVQGKAKLVEIANELGIKNKKGQPLNLKIIDIILKNAEWRYRGIWYANKENKDKDSELIPENKKYQIVQLRHGPLIAIDLLDKVMEKLNIITPNKKYKTGFDSYTYLFSGILYDESGNSLSGQYGKKGEYRYYYNHKLRRRYRCDEIDKTIRDGLKNYFIDGVNTYKKIIKEKHKELLTIIPVIDNNILEIENKLLEIKTNDLQVNKLFSLDKLNDPIYSSWLKNHITDFQNERLRLESKADDFRRKKALLVNLQEQNDTIEALGTYLSDKFERLPQTMQRVIVEKVIVKIVLKETNQAKIFIATPKSWSVTSQLFEDESSKLSMNGGISPHLIVLFCHPLQLIDTIVHSFLHKYADKTLLYELYIIEKLSIRQIAKKLSSAKETIRNQLVKWEIPLRAVHRGHGRTAQVKFGQRMVNGKVVKFKKEQLIIEQVNQMSNNGLSLREIATQLNNMGIPTKCKGQGWHPEMIRRILKNN